MANVCGNQKLHFFLNLLLLLFHVSKPLIVLFFVVAKFLLGASI